MVIASGTRLGPYEIVAPIGAGGMGEVWRGRDTRLERSVAIKILPAEFAQNAQFKLRFEREAKTISQLSHPHICTLYDVGENYLVMELLEGETLADRLARGAIPVEQTLRYAIEIAEALDRAHKAGVIHRDLKPGNIMLTKSGVKLLDFGLAKHSPAFLAAEAATEQKPLTEEGAIIGTFQYMAPEQLDGKEADARTDIFAFGAVLYEMITRRRAFEGKTKTSLIAAIIDRDPPPISSIQPMTPPGLDRLVRTCLAKDPEDRWQTAHDVLLELRGIAEATAQTALQPTRRSVHLLWALACVVVAAAAIFATRMLVARHPLPLPMIRASILPPPHATFSAIGTLVGGGVPTTGAGAIGSFAISPDGSSVVFIALDSEGHTLLWLRRLDGFGATPLRDSGGASYPFFSHDGKFIGFFAEGKLKKISILGGLSQAVCEAQRARGGAWNRDGLILFAPTSRDPIYRVGSDGVPKPATQLDQSAGEFSHRWPSFLPDGKHFLYLSQAAKRGESTNALYVGAIDSPMRKYLLNVSSGGFYSQGYLLFCRDKVVFAQKFDPDRLELSGEAKPIADDVLLIQSTAGAIFAVSDNGVLAYQTGAAEPTAKLAWIDRSGKQLDIVGAAGNFGTFRLAPDGTKVAFDAADPRVGTQDLWLYDFTRGVMSRVTFGPTWNGTPIWSADGRDIIFRSARNGPVDLYHKPLAGTGNDQPLIHSDSIKFAGHCSPDGKWLAFYSLDPKKKAKFDIWMYSFGRGTAEPFVQSPFNEVEPEFSPDGRWLAYVSDESGRNQVYLAPFPGPGAKMQITTNGGVTPRWRADGKELFFLSSDLTINSVEIGANGQPSAPKPLFKIHSTAGGAQYDVAPKGDRLLVAVPIEEASSSTISVVLNWTSELQK
jgi:Tol biopolymer transport system component/predicted Ser/Thr protein kinase